MDTSLEMIMASQLRPDDLILHELVDGKTVIRRIVAVIRAGVFETVRTDGTDPCRHNTTPDTPHVLLRGMRI